MNAFTPGLSTVIHYDKTHLGPKSWRVQACFTSTHWLWCFPSLGEALFALCHLRWKFLSPGRSCALCGEQVFLGAFWSGLFGFLFGGGAGDLFWDLFGLEIQIFVLNLCKSQKWDKAVTLDWDKQVLQVLGSEEWDRLVSQDYDKHVTKNWVKLVSQNWVKLVPKTSRVSQRIAPKLTHTFETSWIFNFVVHLLYKIETNLFENIETILKDWDKLVSTEIWDKVWKYL